MSSKQLDMSQEFRGEGPFVFLIKNKKPPPEWKHYDGKYFHLFNSVLFIS